ncbi:MAG: hypothetical protein Q2306_02500 (plasmid) [Phytoplasma sp.]|uniref:hypothetical protein n=1 Tax=Phytoplasma sp. TaxID=2155 RepID=UPI002B412E29|nr:hypothetical protein [Phytoplasma sp.]WRH06977.1 MAG: hypothetical protein Q2306_02500 [Phytoplasma sp.]
MQNIFNHLDLEQIIEFFKNAYNVIITFGIDIYDKLTGIRNIKGLSIESMQTIFQFLLGLIYLLVIGTVLLYSSIAFSFLKTIIKIIYKIINYILIKPLVFLVKIFIKGLIRMISNTKVTTNEKTPNLDVNKELLMLRLQNGKLKKQIERSKINEFKTTKK